MRLYALKPLTVSALGLILAHPALAQAVTDDIYDCAGIESDSDRLACYDAAVGRLKEAETAGEVKVVTREQVEAVQKDSFGFSIPSLPSFSFGGGNGENDKALESVEFGVERIRETAYGKLIVTLENDQVWEQIDSKDVYYSKRKGVESAEVKRAALGSFRMKLDGGAAFRVKRIQ